MLVKVPASQGVHGAPPSALKKPAVQGWAHADHETSATPTAEAIRMAAHGTGSVSHVISYRAARRELRSSVVAANDAAVLRFAARPRVTRAFDRAVGSGALVATGRLAVRAGAFGFRQLPTVTAKEATRRVPTGDAAVGGGAAADRRASALHHAVGSRAVVPARRAPVGALAARPVAGPCTACNEQRCDRGDDFHGRQRRCMCARNSRVSGSFRGLGVHYLRRQRRTSSQKVRATPRCNSDQPLRSVVLIWRPGL